MASSKILILSDGTPWRPLITVSDMARAIGWAAQRPLEKGGAHLIVNTGSDEWNYRVIDLGKIIKNCIPHIELEIANTAPGDDRSYRVDFSLFNSLGQGYLPESKIEDVVVELWEGLNALNFDDPNFRESTLCRLVKIQELIKNGCVDNQLRWSVL
jgi:nucleoside-diphosphate-sugar epimerase